MSGDSTPKPPALGDYLRFLRDNGEGMTRQQLASKLHTSVGYVAKLEGGLGKSPSTSVLEAISSTFNLAPAEVRHLYNLARQTPTERESYIADDREEYRRRIEPEQLLAMENLEPNLGAYLDERWNVIACNTSYDRVFPGLKDLGNVLLWFFLEERSRYVMVEWEEEARLTVRWFRALMGRYYNDDWAQDLLASLNSSEEFRQFWADGDVTFGRSNPYMRLRDYETGEEFSLHVNVFSHAAADNYPMQFYLGVRMGANPSA